MSSLPGQPEKWMAQYSSGSSVPPEKHGGSAEDATCHKTAVDSDALPRHIGCCRHSQKPNYCSNFRRFTNAPHRRPGEDPVQPDRVAEDRLNERSADIPGSYGVDPDSILCPLGSK